MLYSFVSWSRICCFSAVLLFCITLLHFLSIHLYDTASISILLYCIFVPLNHIVSIYTLLYCIVSLFHLCTVSWCHYSLFSAISYFQIHIVQKISSSKMHILWNCLHITATNTTRVFLLHRADIHYAHTSNIISRNVAGFRQSIIQVWLHFSYLRLHFFTTLRVHLQSARMGHDVYFSGRTHV